MRTVDFLDALKLQRNLPSDYAVAAALNITRQQVSHYRNRREVMSDEVALRMAEALGMKAEFVLACVAAERAKSEPARLVWQRIAAAAASVAVGFFAIRLALPPPERLVVLPEILVTAEPMPGTADASGLCIMLSLFAIILAASIVRHVARKPHLKRAARGLLASLLRY